MTAGRARGAAASDRATVSVVIPFLGDGRAAASLREALAALDLARGDEAIVADNTAGGVARARLAEAARVVRETAERSSYTARNAGARAAGGDWLLFMDADCTPAPGLLAAYFEIPPAAQTGAVAGAIVGDPEQSTLLARYGRSRRFFDQVDGMHTKHGGAATANLLVRRAAFEEVGGFATGIRSGGDVDLCWRLQAAGWGIERRPRAVVRHRHRDGLASLLGAQLRYGAGARWLAERHPGESGDPWPLVPGLIGVARDIPANLVRGRFEEAVFRGVDGLGLIASTLGHRRSNAAGQQRVARAGR